jgi:hypothetical protein
VDLNADGLLDLVQVNLGEPTQIWMNVGAGSGSDPGAMGHWLDVTLRQDGPNRDAVGAWLEVRVGSRVQRWERTVGGGHAGGRLGPIHVGLGGTDQAELRVRWPDGAWSDWSVVSADTRVLVARGAAPVEQPVPAAAP